MQENKLFEALLDVIPFAAYAVDIETFEVVYANKMMSEKMYAPREEFCWKKLFGQEQVCSWCNISTLKQRERIYKSEKMVTSFFDESTDSWLQSYDELVRWPDGRTVKYSIAVDITDQKEIQAKMIQTNTKLAIQTKKLQEANEKLKFLAAKDQLTGINNRGNFFTLFKKLLKSKTDQELYVSMLDLDKFKSINDTYGHSAGDKVLKSFVSVVQEFLDKDDIFARIGGEEFALVIPCTCKEQVIKKLDSLREKVSKTVVEYEESKISYSVSIGLAKKSEEQTIDQALDVADKELYKAKETGRNNLKFRV